MKNIFLVSSVLMFCFNAITQEFKNHKWKIKELELEIKYKLYSNNDLEIQSLDNKLILKGSIINYTSENVSIDSILKSLQLILKDVYLLNYYGFTRDYEYKCQCGLYEEWNWKNFNFFVPNIFNSQRGENAKNEIKLVANENVYDIRTISDEGRVIISSSYRSEKGLLNGGLQREEIEFPKAKINNSPNNNLDTHKMVYKIVYHLDTILEIENIRYKNNIIKDRTYQHIGDSIVISEQFSDNGLLNEKKSNNEKTGVHVDEFYNNKGLLYQKVFENIKTGLIIDESYTEKGVVSSKKSVNLNTGVIVDELYHFDNNDKLCTYFYTEFKLLPYGEHYIGENGYLKSENSITLIDFKQVYYYENGKISGIKSNCDVNSFCDLEEFDINGNSIKKNRLDFKYANDEGQGCMWVRQY